MDKGILEQYIDACELVKETEEQIRRLKNNRNTVVVDTVKGSMHDFPFAPKSFRQEGIAHDVVADPGQLDREELILEERLQNAKRLKCDVEAWLNTVPARMQRIVRYKFFEEMTWEQVARRLGRKATGEGVRKEFENFIGKN